MHFPSCLKASHYSWFVEISSNIIYTIFLLYTMYTHSIWLVHSLKLLLNCKSYLLIAPTPPQFFICITHSRMGDDFLVVRFNLFSYSYIFYTFSPRLVSPRCFTDGAMSSYCISSRDICLVVTLFFLWCKGNFIFNCIE